jgi:STE24 endopeptidase
MTPKQIEAVFAHEAGHVRHHHIPHFLMFALSAWVLVAVLMEALAVLALRSPDSLVSLITIQTAGMLGTLALWGIGFGWVSRRFERQADLFGARCAAPLDSSCEYPCSVHPDDATRLDQSGRVCATGAAIFASALERVALLNGIPREERSWRHSSIASRIRFLLSLAADPSRAVRFERIVRRTQIIMLVIGLGGSAASLLYWRAVGTPALIRLQTGEPSSRMVSPIAQSERRP